MTENNNEEQTLETTEKVEKPDSEESTSKVEESAKQEIEEDIEPPKRFPAEGKTNPLEKQVGYLTRKLEKLEKERQSFEGEDTNNDFSSLEDGEDAPLTKKEFQQLMAERERETMSERMVSDFLNENPNYKNIERKLRTYIKDSDYANIPIGFIASGIVGENIDSEANKRAKEKIEADKEAAKTKTGGSSNRGIPGKVKSVWDMSSEEFEKHQVEVLQKGRD